MCVFASNHSVPRTNHHIVVSIVWSIARFAWTINSSIQLLVAYSKIQQSHGEICIVFFCINLDNTIHNEFYIASKPCIILQYNNNIQGKVSRL